MPQHGGMAGNSSRQIGSYELFDTLGSGALAKVYRGLHMWLHREAAVKVLYDPLNPEKARQFVREAQLVADLEHENIVKVIDFGIENGIPFLVMELAPGGSLQQHLRSGQPLPLDMAVSYIKQLASALQCAHDANVVHRDVKPANMLLSQDGKILLSDFGIAFDSTRPQASQEAVGTVLYAAPEQIQGKPVKASDQYSAAIVVYELLAGSTPFTGTKDQVIKQHLRTSPPPIRSKNPNIPVSVERVLTKALSKKPGQRYSSISAFADALEQASLLAIPGQPATPVPARPALQRTRHRMNFPFVLVALVMVFLALASLVMGIVSSTYPAMVTITPKSERLTRTYTLSAVQNNQNSHQVSERSITSTSSPHSQMVKATGVGQTQTTRATGSLMFYNGSNILQTVAVNTRLVSSNGIAIVTDEAAVMNAANPPVSFGVAKVSAHAVIAGASGNITAYSINQVCCANDSPITVKNIAAFTGGQDARTYSFVQQSDVDGATMPLLNVATIKTQTSLSAQVRSNEGLSLQSVQCKHTTASNPAINEIATSATVTVRVTCVGNVYDRSGAISTADTQFKTDLQEQLGPDYALEGDIKTDLVQVSADITHNSIILLLKVEGQWVFQFNNERRQTFVKLIVARNTKQAYDSLYRQDGVLRVRIKIPWWVPPVIRDTLPTDVHRITLAVAT